MSHQLELKFLRGLSLRVYNRLMDDLLPIRDWPKRVRTLLEVTGLRTWDELAAQTERELLRIPKCGHGSVAFLKQALAATGRSLRAPEPDVSTLDHWVYVMHCGAFAKIGYCNNLQTRLSGIQTGCPYRVVALGAVRCTYGEARSLERALHRRFRALRIGDDCEWFKYESPLLEYVAGMPRCAC